MPRLNWLERLLLPWRTAVAHKAMKASLLRRYREWAKNPRGFQKPGEYYISGWMTYYEEKPLDLGWWVTKYGRIHYDPQRQEWWGNWQNSSYEDLCPPMSKLDIAAFINTGRLEIR